MKSFLLQNGIFSCKTYNLPRNVWVKEDKMAAIMNDANIQM